MRKENSIEFKLYGKYALFSDPINRVGGEKTSYPVPTYQALKGITESIYWKPTILWKIDEVRVMKPIQMESKGIRPVNYTGGNTLSLYTYLRDVEYHVKAHFEWNENRPELEQDRNENKHYFIAKRMLERGGRRDIFLGTRECQGYVEPCPFEEGQGEYDNVEELSFGLMVHGITYPDEAVREEEKGKLTLRFWKPVMKKGVISFVEPEECEIRREIRQAQAKQFGDRSFSGLKEFDELLAESGVN
ncbi:MAG: type I-C CRISPR-associated protein Cas5c [Lachnospiraceae bacterium]